MRRFSALAVLVLALAAISSGETSAAGGATTWIGRGVAPVISGDGRYVAWVGNGPDLSLYRYDRLTGDTLRLAEDANSATIIKAAISRDGKYIAFTKGFEGNAISIADAVTGEVKTVPGATGEVSDISADGSKIAWGSGDGLNIRDLHTGESVIIPESGVGMFSDDGALVAFISWSEDLGVQANINQVFVRNLDTGETELVSRSAIDGSQANEYTIWPSISNDGRYVVFDSPATNLHPDDTDPYSDSFMWDRDTREMSLVSSVGFDGYSVLPRISGNGRQVVYVANQRLVVRNLETGDVEETSINDFGESANDVVPAVVGAPQSISDDGRLVPFATQATNLVPGHGGDYNVYLHDREAPLFSPRPTESPPPSDGQIHTAPVVGGLPGGGGRPGTGTKNPLTTAAVFAAAAMLLAGSITLLRRGA